MGAQLGVSVLGLLVAGGCMAWMVWRALHGEATLGDLALFYQAFNQGQSLLQGLLTNAGQLVGSLIYLGNLYEFLDLETGAPLPAEPVQPGGAPVTIAFEGVDFTYPGGSSPVLQNFNLTLPGGKLTAILGDNGAGKSTLIKLICRLYDPHAGTVRWNGCDLRNFDPVTYWQHLTVLFQEPVHYFESAFINIQNSRFENASPAEVYAAAGAAGADDFILALPKGYDTELGKLFKGGLDLSAGQWQRIALARAFLRQAPLMLLDEPTSAMDAWAETEWLGRLRKLIAGRTAVIITHRLTTAMQADLICVMVAGKIIESGTHTELLALKGRYAEAWQAQTGSTSGNSTSR
jgi:ATP-binding cassette subfamily B protein